MYISRSAIMYLLVNNAVNTFGLLALRPTTNKIRFYKLWFMKLDGFSYILTKMHNK